MARILDPRGGVLDHNHQLVERACQAVEIARAAQTGLDTRGVERRLAAGSDGRARQKFTQQIAIDPGGFGDGGECQTEEQDRAGR